MTPWDQTPSASGSSVRSPLGASVKTVRLAMRRCKVGRSRVSASASSAGHARQTPNCWAEDWLMGDFGIGAAVRRKEDFRFLTGQGTYTDDINRPGQLLTPFSAQPPRSCGAGRHRHRCRQEGAWRRCGLHRRRSASGRSSLRLARHFEGRQADDRATAPTARPG